MFIASLLCALVECKKRGLSKRSIYCKPRHTMIPTSRDGSYLHPQFVWVKRCGGTDGLRDRHTYICVSNRTRIITETVTTDLDTTSIIEFEEHLECTMRPCSEETLQCDSGLKYNDLMCRCDRVCESTSAQKNNQSLKGYISVKFMVIALVAEMALLLLMIFLVNVIRVYCPSENTYYSGRSLPSLFSRMSSVNTVPPNTPATLRSYPNTPRMANTPRMGRFQRQFKSRESIRQFKSRESIRHFKSRDSINRFKSRDSIHQSKSRDSIIDQSKSRDSIIDQTDSLHQQYTKSPASHFRRGSAPNVSRGK